MKEPILIFLFPYKVLDKTIELNEILYFKKYIKTEIWDLSLITSKKFHNKISARPTKIKEIIYYNTYKQFYCNLSNLIKNSKIDNIYIANDVTYSTCRQFICLIIMNILLPKKRTYLFDYQIIGLPLVSKSINLNKINLFSRFKNIIYSSTSLIEFYNRVLSIILKFIWNKINKIQSHRIVAGNFWKDFEINNLKNKKIKLIDAHTQDFSSYLINKNKFSSNERNKYSLFLNSAGPINTSDTFFLKRKEYRTTLNWYPSVNLFFNFLESEFSTKIKIAAHYKADLINTISVFNGREVICSNTIEYVFNSKFIIAINSTAISYGVIFQKPIILIYSDELLNDFNTMNLIRNISNELNLITVNIDNINSFDLINLKTSIDQEKYELFVKNYLSSDPLMRPNYEIILNDIIGINSN